MLKLHFAPNSRAGRIVWLPEELGLERRLRVPSREDAAARVRLRCQVGRFGFAPDSPLESQPHFDCLFSLLVRRGLDLSRESIKPTDHAACRHS